MLYIVIHRVGEWSKNAILAALYNVYGPCLVSVVQTPYA